MNNQNRPKANYHLLATVATLGPVRGGGYVRIKVFELGAKRRKGSGESGPQCPPGGCHEVTGGDEENCSELGAPSETLQGGDNSLYLPLIVLLTIIAYF